MLDFHFLSGWFAAEAKSGGGVGRLPSAGTSVDQLTVDDSVNNSRV